MLDMCGYLGSLSDGCMTIVQAQFNFIYNFLATGMKPQDTCDAFGLFILQHYFLWYQCELMFFAGMCTRLYGEHVITMSKKEDETCSFCMAVVDNLRINIMANTTKEEFKMVKI